MKTINPGSSLTTTSTQDEAIHKLHTAWTQVRDAMAILGIDRGEFNITLSIKGDLKNEEPKTTVEFYHYHYQNFDSAKRTTGLEWNETAQEFLRSLRRDQSLLRLTRQED